jgi:D-alanine transaminase
MTHTIVYLNGEFLPSEQANISVFDRGFLFGDGVYEVIPVYASEPFHLKEHLLRLKSSLKISRFTATIDLGQLEKNLLELLKRNQNTCGDCLIYVQITRGTDTSRKFYFAPDLKPTILATLQAIKLPTYKELCLGKTAITLPDIRWQHNHIKTISLLPSVLLYEQVRDAGCDEGVLIRNGSVVEGISSNIFIVRKNKIITPLLSQENLSGVTRKVVLQLLKQNKIPVAIQQISVEKLFEADEVWITSSTRGIYPIVILDGKEVGDGKPGPIWKKAVELYSRNMR